MAVFGFGRLGHLTFKVGAGQIVEQQIVGGAEEVLPAGLQVQEERGAVRVDAIQTFVEAILGGDGEILAEQLIHGAGQKPAAMQMPLAAR